MYTFLPRVFICLLLILTGAARVYSQPGSANRQYDSLSLRDLLSIKIVSVSKKTEFLFDAPLSASVVTKEDIRKAGCTSIMEALRLVPGMIVREQTNGNYDIHLRGMDNAPPNAPFEGNSTTTLVMIDSRPIYNYLKGGTFWETLPVDLNDVDKIEVIRGPAAALYGPNAVNGVINIITRRTSKEGLSILANAQQGSRNTYINNASIGFQSKKWSIIASGNHQARNRSQSSYYEFFRDEWLDQPAYSIGMLNDTLPFVAKEYPQRAMRKYGGNVFLNYEPDDQVNFSLSTGIQHSIVQKVSTENGYTPLSTVLSDTRYVDLRASIKGVSTQFAYIEGTQSPFHPGHNKYNFNTIDANIEYNYTKGNLSIKPGFSYRSAIYDDTEYYDTVNKTGVFNARGRIITKTVSLRGEYKMFQNKLRLVAGLALNKFNFPDKVYTPYQLAATYKINSKHLVRGVYSQAQRSATFYDTYVNQRVFYTQIGYQKYMTLWLLGRKDLKLLTAKMFEIGYRGTITRGLDIDIEIFDIQSKNYNSLVINPSYVSIIGNDTILITPLSPTNLPVRLHQQGITVSLTYQSAKVKVKPFITLQRSRIKNYAPFLNTPDATWPMLVNPASNNIFSGVGTETTHKSTPASFGGASFNWMPGPKLNINVSAYYYTAQTYYHASNFVFNDGVRGIDHIPAKMLINTSISYEPVKGLHLFCSGKNILNDKSREYFRSDTAPFMLLGGINFEF